MDSDSNAGLAGDKQWAKKYLLDPLTAPEPSQETGPGSSFLSPIRRSQSRSHTTSNRKKRTSPSPRATPPSYPNYPTPPSSASPTSSAFHQSNPFRSRGPLRPRQEGNKRRQPAAASQQPPSPSEGPGTPNSTGLPTPITSPTTRYPPRASQTRNYGQNPRLYWTPEDEIGETSRSPPHLNTNPFVSPSSTGSRSIRSPDLWANFDSGNPDPGMRRSASTNTRPPPPTSPRNTASGLRRNRSLSERFAGDMSHRPLDMLKRDARAADRAPHLGRKKHPNTDQIDVLDKAAFGGAYHHGGPYDATLASRNTNPIYSPVAAVKHSNMEALKATPREYVQDSLEKHVPLQGTAIFPPGERDFGGKVMQYEEGADLMREPDAVGGAYKRWDGVNYHPEDFKGKGEPSYTVEKTEKERRRLRKNSINGSGPGEYEMQPGVNQNGKNSMVRQRSVSSAAAEPSGQNGASTSADGGLQRSNTTGKRLSDGLKRRFGSLRRKKVGDEEF